MEIKNTNVLLNNTDIISAKEHSVLTIDQELKIRYKDKEILKSQWMPQSLVDHTEEFVAFIDSFLYDKFKNKSYYLPFELYKLQAHKWIEQQSDPNKFSDIYLKKKVALEEVRRIDDNALYFADKYGYVKEGSDDSGLLKYRSKEHNALLYYLIDCGYCLLVGKPRQIFATTTIGLFCLKRLITRYNFYMKFITVDDAKGLEILRDKFKFPFNHLQNWMKSNVVSDRESVFHLGSKKKKGEVGLPNSRIEQLPPSPTAINGGSPQITFIDEVGEVSDLIDTLLEIRPTLFVDKHQNGDLQLVRQIIAWGCVCAGTKVWNNNGDLINIEDLKKEDGIIGYNKREDNFSKEKITYWQPPKEKPCYRITTNTGRFLECSEDHPILWSRGDCGFTVDLPKIDGKRIRKFTKETKFVETKDIKIGDQVAVIKGVDIFGDKKMWQPRFIGWLIGDGTYGKGVGRMARLSNCDEEINNYIESNFDTTTEKTYLTKEGKTYKDTRFRGITPMLRGLGIYGQSKLEKRLPLNHHSYCKEDICELLGGLFDTDGHCDYLGNNCKIHLTSSCYELLNEVRFLLQKLGIYSNISRVKARIKEGRKDKNDWFSLDVDRVNDVMEFHKNIHFYIGYKQDRLNISIANAMNKESKSAQHIKGLDFEKVISVEYIGLKPVYNLTAGTTNTYVANGIVTHNTGVSSAKGKKAFEVFWNQTLALWEAKNFRSCIFIPVFLSWDCRCSEEVYKQEEQAYKLSNTNMALSNSVNDRIALFNMHFPSCYKDMFGSMENTLVSKDLIIESQLKVRRMDATIRPVPGYFEPVYDYTQKQPENSDTPYKIIDATWCTVDDFEHDKITAYMLTPPDKKWINRYYQGTDPIGNETGISFMSSVIWDSNIPLDGGVVTEAPVCLLYHRKQYNPKETYMQCVLMGLYYDTNGTLNRKNGVPELIENNIGINYKEFKERLGYGKNIVLNTELFDRDMQGGGSKWGVNTSGMGRNRRKMKVIGKLRELIMAYHKNILFEIFWRELETYVNVVKTSDETWQPVDKKIYRDDCLDATSFAYICRCSYSHRIPKLKEEENNTIGKMKRFFFREANGDLTVKMRKMSYARSN